MSLCREVVTAIDGIFKGICCMLRENEMLVAKSDNQARSHQDEVGMHIGMSFATGVRSARSRLAVRSHTATAYSRSQAETAGYCARGWYFADAR